MAGGRAKGRKAKMTGGGIVGMGYSLRKMKKADIPQVIEIEKQSFPTPWSAYAFQCELADNDFAHYLVVTAKNDSAQVLGYGGVWIIIDEAHLTNIAIAPGYRGQKLGEFLLKGLEMIALEKGAVCMTLEVRVSNEKAKALYQRLGFVPSGIRPNYYVDGHEDALIMWKEFRTGNRAGAEGKGSRQWDKKEK